MHKSNHKLIAALVLAVCLLAIPHAAVAQTNSLNNINLTAVPVTTTAGGAVGTLTGTLDVVRFFVQNGQLMAAGLLNGAVTNTLTGAVTQIVNQLVTIPITATGSCPILKLDLGAIHLDVLGLVVDLSAVHLNITAQAGSGNLLGNLLCTVAHLLDANGPLTGVANVLNQILRIL